MTAWTRACSAGGDCIEARVNRIGRVVLRTSTYPTQTIIATRQEWEAFLAAAKNGELDHLATAPDTRGA